MLTHTPGRHALLRLAATIPVVLGLACAFSFSTKAAQIRYTDRTAAIETTDLATAAAIADGDRKPLVIVDGVERPSLDGLDPSQIQEITILKDASATTLYGDRARDGVIVVTLKPAPGTPPTSPSTGRSTPTRPSSRPPSCPGSRAATSATSARGCRAASATRPRRWRASSRAAWSCSSSSSATAPSPMSKPSPARARASRPRPCASSARRRASGPRAAARTRRCASSTPCPSTSASRTATRTKPRPTGSRCGAAWSTPATPLQGALVVSRGTTSGVVTDKEGAFSIHVAPTATLDVSLVGYETVGVRADTQELTVVLVKGGATTADEIVVVSYGQRKR